MPADTVTPIRPTLQHLDSCDREVYGRAVLTLMQAGGDAVTAEAVRDKVAGFRSAVPCSCLAWRIRTVRTDLCRAQKAWEHSTTDAHAQRVEDLKTELTRLRDMA